MNKQLSHHPIYAGMGRAFSKCVLLVLMHHIAGCAGWDYSAAPQQQAYGAALIQQSAFDQQLRNQQYAQSTQAMINQYQANMAAQRQLQQYNQLQGQLNHMQRSINYQQPSPVYRYIR